MMADDDMRPGEKAVTLPLANDAGLIYIGRIRTPWITRADCPRRGSDDGPLCHIEIFPPWHEALGGVAAHPRLEVLYWLHRSRRDLVLQSPRNDGRTTGVFSLRSPVRPNPIGSSIVRLEAIAGATLLVRGLDCIDETPLIDIKPERSRDTPLAPPTRGDHEQGTA